MKKRDKVVMLILGILSIVGTVLCVIAKRLQNKAVSIIGGADGPTSIFIAGKLGSSVMTNIGIAVLLIAVIGFVFLIRRKK